VVSVIPGGAILGNRLASFALLEAAGSWIANWFPLQYVIDMMSRGSAAKFAEELTELAEDLAGVFAGAEHPLFVHASKEPNPHLEGSVSVHGTHCLVVESQLYGVDPGSELGLRVSTYQTTTAIATTKSRIPAPSIILWAVVSIFFVLRK